MSPESSRTPGRDQSAGLSGPASKKQINLLHDAREKPPVAAAPFWTLSRGLLLAFTLATAIVGGVLFGVLMTFLGEIPLASDLKAYQPSLATKIYDAKGNLVTELFSEQRTLVTLDQVPKQMQQAVIAIEDNNFYQHFGIQFSGILRSFMVNFLHKRYKQGGSTITQQLARNMFLTMRKTIERKIKEIILALQIERTYTKNEILEMYLNQIYFGNGAYGIESASRAYFGKHAQDLNLAECALIAGLPQAPNTYNPYRNLKRARQRRNLVLTQMQRLGYISAQEAAEAKAAPIELSSIEISEAPYFVEYVRQQLEDRYGSNAIYKGGLKVYTTLDLPLQRMAQDAMNEGLAEAEKIINPQLATVPGQPPEKLQCALLVENPATGEIKAMIGGRNFKESKFNRAVQAQRQPGSAFKPFIYTAAISKGFTQADMILDAPVVFKNEDGEVWKPGNFSNTFHGPTTLRTALTHSRNVVTVKLLDKIGVNSAIETARRLGIASPLKPFLTLALGASEVNLLELVSAYGCFPNRGIRAEPVSILRVEDAEGNILEENTSLRQEVLDDGTAAILVDLLQNVVNRGTGYTVRRLGFKYPAGGKTGTTNDYTDAWFIGFTGDYVAGIWLGLDSHASLGRGITGGKVASPIWAKLMLKVYAEHKPKAFPRSENVTAVNFCQVSGLLANPECGSNAQEGLFALGTAPTRYCDVHRAAGSVQAPAYNLNVSPDLVQVTGEGQAEGLQDEEDGEAAPLHPRARPARPDTGPEDDEAPEGEQPAVPVFSPAGRSRPPQL